MGFGQNTSPFLLTDRDGAGNVNISLTVPYDDDLHGSTHLVNGAATVFRDPSSPRTKVVIGDPDNPDHIITIPLGTHSVSVATMNAFGVVHVEDLTATQITFI
jgi:hypothetical protein